MSISIIKDNTVWYPKSIYYKYNIYLIDEYQKFLENTTSEHAITRIKSILDELQELLYDNTVDGDPNLPLPVTKIFNVMEWEENLIRHFNLLDISVKYRNENLSKYKGSMPIKSIMYFLRKEKLEKLNSL